MFDYQGRSLKAQMRRANKYGARYVLMIGEDELHRGTVVLRDMEERRQQEIPLLSVPEEMINRLGGGSP